MKKILCFLVMLLTILSFGTISNADVSMNVSASTSQVDPGGSFTVTISVSGGEGYMNVSATNGTVSPSKVWVGDGDVKVNCKAGTSGKTTISLSGTVADKVTTLDVPKSGRVSVNINTPPPEPTPPPAEPTTPATPAPSEPVPSTPDPTPPTAPTQPAQPTQPTAPVVETKSSDATLKNLGIRPNDFSGFKKYIMVYNHEVPNSVDKVEIYAEKSDSKAKIISGTGTKNLSIGLNSFDVVVEAEDGTRKTYTLKITRKEVVIGLDSLSISGVELSPKFNSETYSYTVDLKEDLEQLQIQTKPTIANSKVKITGNEKLQDGENIITILVTHEDTEEAAKYEIKVNKEVEAKVEEETELENEVTLDSTNTIETENSVKNDENTTKKYNAADNVNSTKPILRTLLIVFAVVFIVLIIVISYIIKKEDIKEFDANSMDSEDSERARNRKDKNFGNKGKHS